MADNTSKKEGSFDERALAAVESNDITYLQNLLNQHLAEDPNAFLPYANLGASLGKALELSQYDMADEVFKRGAM